MYKKILICLDNSDHSTTGIDYALEIARSMDGGGEGDAGLTGLHVYAARLHNSRFREMEEGLPPEYRSEEELQRQRDIHDDLITRGLRMISDSYMTPLDAKALASGITPGHVHREGKNYEEIVREASEGPYDLVVMGALGLGATEVSTIGSVCERVVRRVTKDVLVVRDAVFTGRPMGKVLVAVDGSSRSFGAVKTAAALSRVFSSDLEVVSAYDPDYHHSAFRSIAGVLTEEAGKVFRFREQERLHTEIIDKGLARIYRNHLDAAVRLAESEGVGATQKLLSGKPCAQIIRHVAETSPWLLVMGRTGVHATETLDIGSTTENCLRYSGCSVLVVSSEAASLESTEAQRPFTWTKEALSVLERIPSFARGIARLMVEDAAARDGIAMITPEFMERVRKGMKW